MGYVCDNHPDKPADVLVTNLNNGDVLALCGPDFPEYVDSLHAVFHGVAEVEAEAGATPGSDDDHDEDEPIPFTVTEPATETPAPAATPGSGADDGEDQAEDLDQLAEDNAGRDAQLRDELAGSARRS